MAALFDHVGFDLAYYTVPAAFVLLFAPHMYAVQLAGKNHDLTIRGKMVDNVVQDEGVPKKVRQRIIRAEAATANGLETIGLYAAAVVAAKVAGVETGAINSLAVAYLASRAVYNYLYVIAQDDAGRASYRSVAWCVGIGIVFTLFIKAGNAGNAPRP
ncbi:hypothetical protein CONLIGDRAFT_711423 [Coniochaeta ligniaria NRRL 30616]|uniref:MAPEG family protein n=1 Tax=Coniochaeta ligniaria NRRL 30616 TaxID=1408157 RepID=A0A1J7J229_9PEZI|nr:hypothetical protein CONLIGDRAFT_711423 [Coniochaeta ligniaria NRRL 30616]